MNDSALLSTIMRIEPRKEVQKVAIDWCKSTASDGFTNPQNLGTEWKVFDGSQDKLVAVLKHSIRCEEDENRILVRNAVFDEVVDLFDLQEAKGLCFINCVFLKPVVGEGAHFTVPLVFHRCYFSESIYCPDSFYDKGLSFFGCFFGMEDKGTVAAPDIYAEFHQAPCKTRSVWMAGVRVTGILRMDACVFAGSVNLSESEIKGPLMMRGISVGEPRKRGRLHLRQLRLLGDLDLSPFCLNREFMSRRRSRIYGSLTVSGSDISGKMDIRGIYIKHRLHMPHVHIRDRLEATIWLHDQDEEMAFSTRTVIGQRKGVSVRLADAVIDHGVWFTGAIFRGQFTGKNMRVGGDLYLRGDDDFSPPKQCVIVLPKSDAAAQERVPARLNEAIRLQGAVIRGSFDCTFSEFRGAINLENVEVGGDLHLRSSRVGKFRNKDPELQYVRLSMAKVGRHLDLRGSGIEAQVVAHGINVAGDLSFGVWNWRNFSFRKQRGGEPVVEKVYLSDFRKEVDFSNATVGGDFVSELPKFEQSLLIRGANFGHNFLFLGGEVAGRLELDGTKVDSAFALNWDEDGGSDEEKELKLPRKLIIGRLLMPRMTIGGNLTVANVHLTGRDASVPSAGDGKGNRESIGERKSAKSDWDLTLSSVRGRIRTYQDAGDVSLTLQGNLKADKLSVGGSCLLNKARIGGSVSMISASIGGDLLFENTKLKELQATGIEVREIALSRGIHDKHGEDDSAIGCFWSEGKVDFSRARIGQLNIRLICVRDKGAQMGDSDSTLSAQRVCFIHNNESFAYLLSHKGAGAMYMKELDLSYSRVGEMHFSGYAPFGFDPHFNMEGFDFEALNVSGLNGFCFGDEKPTPYCLGWACEIRRRLYHWTIPGTAMLTITAACLALWVYDFRNTEYLWAAFHQFWVLGWFISAICEIGQLLAEPCLFINYPPTFFKELVYPFVLLASLVVWVLYMRSSKRRKSEDNQLGFWEWYPKGHALLTKRMPTMDVSLYERIELYLRKCGRGGDADLIYLERRLSQLRSGVTAWLFHGLCASYHQLLSLYRHEVSTSEQIGPHAKNRNRHLQQMTQNGCLAFTHSSIETDKAWERSLPSFWSCVGGGLLDRIAKLPKRLFDRFLLLIVGDGVRVMPAIVLFLGYFGFSWLFVFDKPDSVERPAVFVAPQYAAGQHEDGEMEKSLRWVEVMGTAPKGGPGRSPHVQEENWSEADSFWVALEAHVPLMEFSAREKWRPSSNPVHAMERPIREIKATWLFRFFFGTKHNEWFHAPRADTWAGMSKVIGWILIPVILGAIASRLRKRVVGLEEKE